MKAKTDWSQISREVTVALSTNPHPNQTKKTKVIPVVIRESAIRTEQATIILGRIA